jgi:hypothetical protein
VALYLLFLVHGNYGFNDDYVVVGQIAQSNMGFWNVLEWASSPFSSGRYIAIFLIAIAAPLLSAVDTLQILRIVGLIGWALVSMQLHRELTKLKVSRIFSMTLSLVPIFIPGSQLTLISGNNFYYSWGTLLAIFVSGRIAKQRAMKLNTFVVLTSFALLPTMFYQPISAYLLLIPAISWMLQLSDYQRKNNFKIAIVIYAISILSNWLIVKLFYDSSRLDGALDFSLKIETFFIDTLPMTVIPHLYIFAPDYARGLYPFVILVSVLFHLLAFRGLQLVRYGVINSLLHVCILTGLVPLTLGWLFFINEDGVNFRKIFWGSSVWMILFLLAIYIKLGRNNQLLYAICFFLMLLALAIWTIFFRVTTVQLQEREWQSAVCASKQVKLKADSELALDAFNQPVSHVKFQFKDEIAVSSLSFPGPRTFIPWLSNSAAHPDNIISNAWGIRVSEKGLNEGREWSNEFRACLSGKNSLTN